MRKSFVFLAAAVAFAVSCNKENLPASNDNQTVFSATQEITKTTLEDGGAVNWVAGDKIKIFWNGGEAVAQAATTGATTTFSASVAQSDKYYAVYPSLSASIPAETTDYDFQIVVPKTQHGTFAEANVSVAVTDAATKKLSFKNVDAIVCFTLTRSDLKEVRFRPAPDTKIVGKTSVKLGDGGIPSVVGAENVEAIVTPASGDTFAPGKYYIAVAPITCEQGFQFKMTKTDGSAIPPKTSSKNFSFTRSHIMDFGVIDDTVPTEKVLYTTVSGAGTKDGSSWTNAFDVAALRAALVSGEELGNVTIKMAGGTYVLNNDSEKFLSLAHESKDVRIEGGYNPSDGTRNVASQQTILSGDKKYTIIGIFGANSKFTFDGLTFKDCTQVSTEGNTCVGVISVGLQKSIVVNINNCRFEDNIMTSAANGAVIYASTANINVTNCVFANNKGKEKGSCTYATGSNCFFYMYNCVFYGNSITGNHGSNLYQDCNWGMHKCTIYSTLDATDKNHNVIYATGNYIISSCQIFGNTNCNSAMGVFRADPTHLGSGLIVDTEIMAMHPSKGDGFIHAIWSKNNTILASGGHNLFYAADGPFSGSGFSSSTILATDVAISDLGSAKYEFSDTDHTITWTTPVEGYTHATDAEVKAAINNYVPSTDYGTKSLHTQYLAWLNSLGLLK
ncbi:MAG: hypothetical protein MJY62_00970 [Bacteroidales bacterium]|nr:hypothetical protein [Bacteroidales bacterium]